MRSPSSFLRLTQFLRDEGYTPEVTECAVYDFDMTSAMIGKWADDRGEEVEYVTGGSRPPKNARPVKKYQGYDALLALDFEEETEGELGIEQAAELLRDPKKLREELERMLRGE